MVLFHEVPPEVLQYGGRSNHWDLMLELENGLETWELEAEPNTGIVISAKPLPVHRKHYLNYEGEISDNRGSVTRVIAGTYSIATSAPGGVPEVNCADRILKLKIENTSATIDLNNEAWLIFCKTGDRQCTIEFRI